MYACLSGPTLIATGLTTPPYSTARTGAATGREGGTGATAAAAATTAADGLPAVRVQPREGAAADRREQAGEAAGGGGREEDARAGVPRAQRGASTDTEGVYVESSRGHRRSIDPFTRSIHHAPPFLSPAIIYTHNTQEDMACFTLDPAASPLHVCRMGFLGEMWCVRAGMASRPPLYLSNRHATRSQPTLPFQTTSTNQAILPPELGRAHQVPGRAAGAGAGLHARTRLHPHRVGLYACERCHRAPPFAVGVVSDTHTYMNTHTPPTTGGARAPSTTNATPCKSAGRRPSSSCPTR